MTDYFPCPRKHFQYGISPSQEALNDFGILNMLIYGQKSPSPPPATLTQEQLARDAGQLVEAHALLDKLCDDTDRSQHSLMHRLKQIVYGSEEMNKVLEKAGFNSAAGLLECVKALAQRQKTTKETLDQVEARALGYQLEITRLKDRNKRLHDAQGSGNGLAAELKSVRDTLSKLTSPNARGVVGMAEDVVTMNLTQQGEIVRLRGEAGRDPALDTFSVLKDKVQTAHRKLNTVEQVCTFGTIDERVTSLVDLFKARGASVAVPPEYDKRYHEKLNELLEIERTGTLLERITQAVERLKDYGQRLDLCRDSLVSACKTLGIPFVNYTTDWLAKQINDNLARWRESSEKMAKWVGDAHAELSKAGIAGAAILPDRVRELVSERDRYKTLQAEVLPEAHRMFDRAGIPSGTLCERVRVAIERGQAPKPKPDYLVREAPDALGMWEVVNPQGKVVSTCAALSDAQRICASLRVN